MSNTFWLLPTLKARKAMDAALKEDDNNNNPKEMLSNLRASSLAFRWDTLQKKTGDIPQPGPKEILIKLHASSLNYRDLVSTSDQYPLPIKEGGVIPTSDGAGEVVGLGQGSTLWAKGDRVVSIFNRDHLYGSTPTAEEFGTGFGNAIDGFLTQYAVVPETAVVRIPEYLSFEEAATLSCAAVTAWNGLYGIESESLKPGQTVLVQGTGGVSIFALQIALAAGANVISTSSSQDKFDKVMQALEPTHRSRVQFINYTKVKEWGKEAVKLNNGKGLDFVVEIGGAGTVQQSFEAIKMGGLIANIGHRAAAGDEGVPHVPYLALSKGVIFRGTLIGSRQQFLDLLRTFEANKIKPVIDREFSFEDVPKAYEYLSSGSHVGKIVIKIP
ncbi:hypothetical protein CF326_g670 [Tilletia indica]|nr:hypothetical protein CF326_g670 [Tilletia indica]